MSEYKNKVKLSHIGLNIQGKEELVDFYQNILGFHLEHRFDIKLSLATNIFGIRKQVEVFLYSNENMQLELFVYPKKTKLFFTHICIEVTDREIIAKKCEHAGYKVTRIKRNDKPDILFIRDKTGNIFELKNN